MSNHHNKAQYYILNLLFVFVSRDNVYIDFEQTVIVWKQKVKSKERSDTLADFSH